MLRGEIRANSESKDREFMYAPPELVIMPNASDSAVVAMNQLSHSMQLSCTDCFTAEMSVKTPVPFLKYGARSDSPVDSLNMQGINLVVTEDFFVELCPYRQRKANGTTVPGGKMLPCRTVS